MEDLANLQKRWEEAYEAMPKLYNTPNGAMVNFTISNGVDSIIFKAPWENFELDEGMEAEWRISFFDVDEGKPFGYLPYEEAAEKLLDFSLIQSSDRILIRAMSADEIRGLGLRAL